MTSDFADEIITELKNNSELDNFEIVKSYDSGEISYPIEKPLVCIGVEKTEKLSFLLGYDNEITGSERIIVSVSVDEKKGGSFAEKCAAKICSAVLDADVGKLISTVSIEKFMYDKLNFAYKVIMRFSLGEQSIEIGSGV